MSGVWRCRVCEAVNQGTRTCASCGTVVAVGEPVRAAVRARMPSRDPGAVLPPPPPPVPPAPRRRELRAMPTLEDLLFARPPDMFSSDERLRVRPIPGGCMVAPVPRRSRRRRRGWY